MEPKDKRQKLKYLKDNAKKLPFKAYKDEKGQIFLINLRRHKEKPDQIRASLTPFCAMLQPGTDYHNIGVRDVSVIAQKNDLFDSQIIKQFALWAQLPVQVGKLDNNIGIERTLDQLNNGRPTELASLIQKELGIDPDTRFMLNSSPAYRENFLRSLEALAINDSEIMEKVEYWKYALERELPGKIES